MDALLGHRPAAQSQGFDSISSIYDGECPEGNTMSAILRTSDTTGNFIY